MMQTVFLRLLNMSITAGWLVLAVLLIRGLFKKAPKAFRVVLWGFVGLRLILPFSLESAFSLIPRTETISMELIEIGDMLEGDEEEKLPDDEILETVGAVVGGETEQKWDNVDEPENIVPIAPNITVKSPAQKLVTASVILWLTGIVLMAGYAVISYRRIYGKVKEAVPFKDNVLFCDHIGTPFILGMIRPRIYLPSVMAETDVMYVIAHEQAHLSRKDHWWKPVGFVLLTVYWFNPLLWVAYILLCRDIELACDERVIRHMGADSKKAYSDALINCSAPRRMVAACPLAFGETGVKDRIKSVLSYKRPTFWAMVTAAVIGVAVVLCFLTDPLGNRLDAQLQVLIDCEIANHNQSDKSGENFCCVDWEVLGTKRTGNRLTVYLWAFYQEYSYDNDNNGIKEECGSHIPVAITVEKDDGSYTMVEYWMPRDGSYWVQDIRGKFPVHLWGKATDSQWYVKEQKADCDRMAEEHFAEQVVGDKEFDKRYEFKASDDEIKPYLLLNTRERTFRLVFSGYSGCLPEGSYIITKDEILVLLDGTDRYRFNRENGVYMFDAENSSPIPQYNYGGDVGIKTPIPHGAAFEEIKTGLSEEEWNALPDEKLNVTEPPRLVIYQAHEMVEAGIGNTQWDCEQEDGTRRHVVACGSTMYENRDRLKVIELKDREALLASLQFGVEPDKVTVTCWNMDEENPESEMIEVSDALWYFDLKIGNYVYEIKAEWTRFPRFNGTVEYGFKTVKSGNNSN